MKTAFFLSLMAFLLFYTTLVQAIEYEVIDDPEVAAEESIERPAEEATQTRTSYQGPGLFEGARWGVDLKADNFQNQSFRQSGTSYGLGLNLKKPGKYEIGAGGAYLVGQVRTAEVQEIGNPYVKFNMGLFDISRFEVWFQGKGIFSRPSAKLAARHDTYRAGLEFKLNPLKYVSSLNAGYRWRINEEDPTVNIRDIVDLELMIGRKIFRKWTIFAHGQWYRAYGVEKNKIEIARTAEWMGAGPGLKWQFSPGFLISTSMIYPLSQSRSVEETEIAVWDSSLPSAGDVTWRTDLGVQF